MGIRGDTYGRTVRKLPHEISNEKRITRPERTQSFHQSWSSRGTCFSSGAGKSTITSLLTRLYDPQDGSVSIDGVCLTKMDPQQIRQNVGIVVQESLLFPTTMGDNIRCGSPHATDEEVREAARLAYVLEFADRSPDGLETVVGPRGTQLSGGQKQRVALARCVLKNPPIVIIDEATSALRTTSRTQKSKKAIGIACQGRTAILAAHRLFNDS